MTRLQKIFAICLVLVLSVSMVFAEGIAEQQQTAGVTTLKVLNYRDLTAPNAGDELTMVWDKFNNDNPDVKIIREDLFNDPFHQKVEVYAASGNMPDVLYMWPGGRSTSLQTNKLVKDLMPLLEKDGLVDAYSAAAIAPQAAGYLAELPNGITASHMLFINTKLLKDNGLEMPKTYEDMKAMVPVLKAKGIEVIGMANMSDWVMQSCLFSTVVGRYGGYSWYDDLAAGKIQFTDDWFINSLQFIADIYADGVINVNTLNIDYGANRGDFANGKAAFYIDGDWAAGSFQIDQTTGEGLLTVEQQANDFDMGVMPALPGEVISNTSSGVVGTGWGISSAIPAGSAKEDAAWRLVKFLQGEYVQTWRLQTGGSFPSLTTIDVAAVAEELNLEPFVTKRADFYNALSGTTRVIDDCLQSDVFNVINRVLQEIPLGMKTVKAAAEEVQAAWVAWQAAN